MRALLLAALLACGGAAEGARIDILSQDDVERYRQLFQLEEEDRWEESDALQRELENPILLGHVRYRRYVGSRDYVTPYEELQAWLEAYGDHPGAWRVSRLAHKRRPPGVLPPAPERHPRVRKPTPVFVAAPAPKPATGAGVRRARTIRGHLKRGRPDLAHGLLRSGSVLRELGQDAMDKLRGDIAFAYYLVGKDPAAYMLASQRADAAEERISLPHWVAGLAAYRLGWKTTAARHFAAHSESPAASPWNASAGAFWAGRIYRNLGRLALARRWFRKAAEHKRTFYGMIAREVLQLPHGLNLEMPALDASDGELIRARPAAVRALALAQIGRPVTAEAEMRRAMADADPPTTRALLAAAAAAPLPRAALLAGRRLRGAGEPPLDVALYPLVPWEPEGGFELDRALVLAFMRQESAFHSRARSPAGARGLMQLMPAAANTVSSGPRFRGATLERLLEPELNLTLGHDYLRQLLDKEIVADNLFHLAIAYNAGASRLREWRAEVQHGNDPLLFIESLPAKETRLFVERVLANVWAYRARLNQPRPSLVALAAGREPLYLPLDSRQATRSGDRPPS